MFLFFLLYRRILTSTSSVELNDQLSCITGNPIIDCWQCDPNWANGRQHLANCTIGFGREATGGNDGHIYVVTDSSDNDVADTKPGTLRLVVIQVDPLWIIFSADMQISSPISSFLVALRPLVVVVLIEEIITCNIY